ncbi:hypothetical protein [Mobilicoccus caccae]|uniref:hypothetical protein n=1 Tax=Mobilicoccus caccae TaxID=1859295 RepID=UPI0024E04A1F|nr:hypothetical protein [Mobilicoccus caccae]
MRNYEAAGILPPAERTPAATAGTPRPMRRLCAHSWRRGRRSVTPPRPGWCRR